MRAFRTGLHGLALCAVNFAGIMGGFVAYHCFFKSHNQIAFQAPIAAIFSILAFVAWLFIVQSLAVKALQIQRSRELIWVYIFGLAWCPVLLVPLHYITQGYLTSFGNILGVWMFQLPVNLAAILAAEKAVRSGSPPSRVGRRQASVDPAAGYTGF